MAGVVWWLINLEKKGVGGDSVPYIEFVNSLASSSNVLIVKIEQRKLSRNSNGYNFSLECLIHVHHISRPLKLTTEALGKFKRP